MEEGKQEMHKRKGAEAAREMKIKNGESTQSERQGQDDSESSGRGQVASHLNKHELKEITCMYVCIYICLVCSIYLYIYVLQLI